MPITVHLKKSGRKKVHDQSAKGINGSLERTARNLFRAEGANYTPGPVGLADPLKKKQSTRPGVVLENRRRRKLASLHKISYRPHPKAHHTSGRTHNAPAK
ncbi:MAG: hypothetical protein JWQ71_2661 [Pedosphaera sp.]|nr:hypothetical protein [Pedosphaera sp.]